MRLPSLRVCRYIAERRTDEVVRTGLAAAASQNMQPILPERQTGCLSRHPAVQLVVIILILLRLSPAQPIHKYLFLLLLLIILIILIILLIRRSCAAPKSRYSSKPNIFQF